MRPGGYHACTHNVLAQLPIRMPHAGAQTPDVCPHGTGGCRSEVRVLADGSWRGSLFHRVPTGWRENEGSGVSSYVDTDPVGSEPL